MGEIVLAAKVTHVPTLVMSETDAKLAETRAQAIKGLREIGRRASAAGADTFVVLDTHWLSHQCQGAFQGDAHVERISPVHQRPAL